MLRINKLGRIAVLALSCFGLSARAQTAAPCFPKLSKTLDSLAFADR